MIDIDVSKALKQPGKSFSFSYTGLPELEDIHFAKPLELAVEYTVTGDDVRVVGKLGAYVTEVCTRCLTAVVYGVAADINEIFVKTQVAAEEDADGNYAFFGETVSLDKLVYDAIMLALPQKLLCSEDCKGMCPKCGANLNETECGCDLENEVDESNPFYKLKNLFDESGGE